MTPTYLLSPLAETDLEEIWLYTAREWSVEQAQIYTDDIIATCEDLASGRKEGRRVNIRGGYLKALVGRHMIYAQQRSAGLVVVRILHQSMDVDRHL
ncbi:type II toxin-antitoxin system RelE/ParE family toxin [Ruegeria atlantica]|uniref:type II toxin-antitoxin system RelE/ParE family toxin n=1 Tax=Ruegeria atlantica TaxID=81569 RepID=UPI00148004F4|nr:type II toxin-antitoxin system RelE/ParE family toxin [Ruegeria atlantica]